MLFHTTEAWNLAEAMYTDRKMGLNPDSYVRSQLELGYQQGWIRSNIKQASLEMFVFTDRVYLPPDLDIRTPGDQHMAWRLESWENDEIFYDPDTLIKLLDYVAPQLMFRGVINTPTEVVKIANKWKKQAAKTGQYRHDYSDPVEHAVHRELMMAQRSIRFSADQIPTFTGIQPEKIENPQRTNTGSIIAETDETLQAIRVYFKDQIRVPAPDTFSQALDLRENSRIVAWREKVSEWSAKLTMGDIDERMISEEIADANGHIEGTGFATKLLPWWSSTVTVPLAAYEVLLANHELAHGIGAVLLGFEFIRGLCEIARNNELSDAPLQNKWLLVKSE